VQVVDRRLVLSPSDLNDHVECAHLTGLALEVAAGAQPRPRVPDAYGDLLSRKGGEHERAYLTRLSEQGREVTDASTANFWDFAAAARVTADAMAAGAEVIYQPTFVVGDWRGRADFLERVPKPTGLGAWGYEPVDAKLARTEKPTYLLQLCFYSQGIAAIQGAPPERVHVLLGGGERRTLRHDDFAAYFRRVREAFEGATRQRPATAPYPVEHCALCEFREVCQARWTAEDHLTLVAGIRRAHFERLRAARVTTLAALVALPPDAAVAGIAPESLATLRATISAPSPRRSTAAPCSSRARPAPARRGRARASSSS
jgi:uncharacterized protein